MTIAILVHVSALVFGFANPFAPIFDPLWHFFGSVIDYINGVTHNYGWSMLVLALVVRVALIPLYVQQFKSAKEMQALAPYLKRLQTKYKDNKQKLQEETLALYREHGVNPLGGCLPLLVQLPILSAVYFAIKDHNEQFKAATWAWIGSPLSLKFPHILAVNLAQPDQVLLLLYAVSLYFSVRLTPTPNIDPQQAQMMKINSLIMPVALFFFLRGYPSAFILYWLGFNVISMTQQWIIMRSPSRIGAPPAETPATLAGYPLDCPSCNERLVVVKGSKCEKCGAKVRKVQPSGNGAANAPAAINPSGGGAKQGS
ncbi:MAG TPA: YidC/Oxa1 family membrane protein insertase [Candidatus Eremiobacteraceae bacterium]|nr:YidC/Oxa1 family membrane protein insertase [Candidatus Eremiobacteraceae bacterium]